MIKYEIVQEAPPPKRSGLHAMLSSLEVGQSVRSSGNYNSGRVSASRLGKTTGRKYRAYIATDNHLYITRVS